MKIKTVLLMMMLIAVGSLLSAQGLKVEPGTCIKVETGTTLDISGGGDLFLESDATGDASLIDLGSVSYTGGGEAKVERYLTNDKWHLISAPVAEAVAGQFEDDFLQIHSESTNAYTDVTSLTYGLIPVKGYALWTVDANPTTEVFSGTTNTGSQGFNFTKNGLGYNLMGNPYPSAIDWEEVIIPANLNAHFQLWDPTMGTNGDYRYYIVGGGGATNTSQYIPSGQGFFTQATGAGTMTFNNDDRTHGSQLFYKNTMAHTMLVLKVTGNEVTTQTALRFIEEATPQIDRLFDVQKIISGNADIPNLYSYAENKKMAINTLQSIAGNETVPLFFDAGMNGIYSIDACELQSIPEEVPVFLEDISLNYFQDMRAKPNYSFQYTTGAVRPFNVHFKDVTGIAPLEKLNIICRLSNNILQVNFADDDFEKANISVYSITGQQILSRQTSEANNDIAFNGSQSIYLVRISTNKGVLSAKVFNR